MMRRLALAVVLALATLAGSGCARRTAEPALWMVQDHDTTIYLFGTVHVLRPDVKWFDYAVRAAFNRSDTLVLELVMPPDKEARAIVDDLGLAKDGTRLFTALPEAERRTLMVELPRLGLAPDALDRQEPWMAAMTLTNLPLRRLGYDDKDGAEAVLFAGANREGKNVLGLETLRQQLGYFDNLSPAAQQALLAAAIAAIPKTDKEIDQTVAAWGKGDLDALAGITNRDLAGSPELRRVLLVERNRRWADWIAKRMEQPGTVFVAVGAGHLAGPDSVQAELAKRGLKVERVLY